MTRSNTSSLPGLAASMLPITRQVRAVFGKCLGLVPTAPNDDLAAELATLLGAPAFPSAGTIQPGDLSSITSVLGALLAQASPAALRDRLSALQVFYSAQVASPATLPQIAAVSAAMSQIGLVQADVRSLSNPTLRTGAANLLEFFQLAFDNTTSFSPTMDWCGIFALWAAKTAGAEVGDWESGLGISSVHRFTEHPALAAQPGDVGCIAENQHMFMVSARTGSGAAAQIVSVNGNSGSTGIIQMETRPVSELLGVFRAAGLGT